MELSVCDYLSQNYAKRFPNKRPLTAIGQTRANSSTSFENVLTGSGSSKKPKTNSNTIISGDRPIENLDSSANSSSFSLKENHHLKPASHAPSQQTSFCSSLEQLTSHLTQFAQPDRLDSDAAKMLNGGMMLSINGSQTMNGDNASAFSPNNLTGNGNSSNNTISGLSPSSSYDSYDDARCKEEMSPSSMDCSLDQKKKKGPMPRQQEELCLVCEDRASGYHYNALTCEGCKGFFRRSITKNAVYQCKYGNSCQIDMYMRRKCQECRLKKCLLVGMRPECVVPEYQCAIKRENKRAQKELNKPNSTTKELNNSLSASQETNLCIINKTPELLPQQLETVQKLVFFQEEYESPPEEEVRKITPFTLGETEEDGLKRFKHMTEMTILTVQLIVEFSKKVPGFDTLLREDQITLLKACSSEVMMMRCSRKYDIKTDSILYANNQPYTRENYKSASVDQSADQLFNFCKNMCILKVDNAEYALITAIVIFSERPNLIEPKKVERIQDYYVNILKTYVESKRQPGKCYFAKLLAILTELRTLGNINNEMCVSLKVKNKKLPPFLNELWDLSDS